MLVGTITDDKRLFEVPKLRVCAMRFTETARARILKVSRSSDSMGYPLGAAHAARSVQRNAMECHGGGASGHQRQSPSNRRCTSQILANGEGGRRGRGHME